MGPGAGSVSALWARGQGTGYPRSLGPWLFPDAHLGDLDTDRAEALAMDLKPGCSGFLLAQSRAQLPQDVSASRRTQDSEEFLGSLSGSVPEGLEQPAPAQRASGPGQPRGPRAQGTHSRPTPLGMFALLAQPLSPAPFPAKPRQT